jgi:hypothetical protein
MLEDRWDVVAAEIVVRLEARSGDICGRSGTSVVKIEIVGRTFSIQMRPGAR